LGGEANKPRLNDAQRSVAAAEAPPGVQAEAARTAGPAPASPLDAQAMESMPSAPVEAAFPDGFLRYGTVAWIVTAMVALLYGIL
jgi:hypothetical protein